MYFEQVKSYLDNFENVKVVVVVVVVVEDFKKDAQKILKGLCDFLEINFDFEFDTSYKYNVSGDSKSQLLYQLETSRGLINMIKKFVPVKLVQKI